MNSQGENTSRITRVPFSVVLPFAEYFLTSLSPFFLSSAGENLKHSKLRVETKVVGDDAV
jgi:hypothetical protein